MIHCTVSLFFPQPWRWATGYGVCSGYSTSCYREIGGCKRRMNERQQRETYLIARLELVDVAFGVFSTGRMKTCPIYTDNCASRCLFWSHFLHVSSAYIMFRLQLQFSASIFSFSFQLQSLASVFSLHHSHRHQRQPPFTSPPSYDEPVMEAKSHPSETPSLSYPSVDHWFGSGASSCFGSDIVLPAAWCGESGRQAGDAHWSQVGAAQLRTRGLHQWAHVIYHLAVAPTPRHEWSSKHLILAPGSLMTWLPGWSTRIIPQQLSTKYLDIRVSWFMWLLRLGVLSKNCNVHEARPSDKATAIISSHFLEHGLEQAWVPRLHNLFLPFATH